MPADQLDPILLSRSYFVEPESAGARAYVLLRDSLERSGKVALAIVALRQRESLATLRSRDGVLVLETLLWPDEVRAPAFGFLDDDIEVRSQELKMAASLIDSMTVDFDPGDYHDGYREALQELVSAKAEGREVIQPEEGKSAEGEPASLAEALKASLSAAQDGTGTGKTPAARTAAAKTGTSRTGPSRTGPARSGTARTSTARSGAAKANGSKSDVAKSDVATTGTAKTGGAKTGGATTGTAKTGGAKTGGAKTGGAKSAEAKPRSRRRAS
jgi:DNA end-binding protein Ku